MSWPIENFSIRTAGFMWAANLQPGLQPGLVEVMRMCAPNERQIARDILGYLSEHTAAQDTLEGIVEWWLLEQKIKRETRRVQEVLDDLVARKFISARTARDSRTHYRINRRKIREIRTLLEAADQ